MGLFEGHTAGLYAAFFSKPAHYYTAMPTYVSTAGPDRNTPADFLMQEKQQRAKVHQKRHKGKTFHVQQKKDVPAFLKKMTKDL
jgi:hypothetical protein